jgi:hypothetical protein
VATKHQLEIDNMNTSLVMKRWTRFIKTRNITNTPTTNRFTARLNLSIRFKGINADGFTSQTLRGYSAMMSVFLSFSAFEGLINSIEENEYLPSTKLCVDYKVNKHSHVFSNVKLENELRKNTELLEMLFEYVDVDAKKGITKRIERLILFYMGKSDLNVIASSIRNVVAHGQLTVSGGKVMTKRNADVLFELARLIENETTRQFAKYLEILESKYPKVS